MVLNLYLFRFFHASASPEIRTVKISVVRRLLAESEKNSNE